MKHTAKKKWKTPQIILFDTNQSIQSGAKSIAIRAESAVLGSAKGCPYTVVATKTGPVTFLQSFDCGCTSPFKNTFIGLYANGARSPFTFSKNTVACSMVGASS